MANGTAKVRLIGVGDVQAPNAPANLFEHVASVLDDADIVFGNCEWPYMQEPGDMHPVEHHLEDDIDEGQMIVDGNPESIGVFARAGFNVMSFANNHCLHAGYRAFLGTIDLLRKAGIAPAGAGMNITDALQPAVVEVNGTRVAFVACTSLLLPGTHAGRRTPGVAPLRRHSYFHEPNWEQWGLEPKIGTLVNRDDLDALCASVRAAKDIADVVVMSCHWGLLEQPTVVGAYQREAARAFIDNGADLILGHGPGVRGLEVHNGKAIFYSLGKFLLVYPTPKRRGSTARTGPRPFGTGIAASITIDGGQISRVSFIPTHMDEIGRPTLLRAGDDGFATTATLIEDLTRNGDLPATLSVEGDEILVSA